MDRVWAWWGQVRRRLWWRRRLWASVAAAIAVLCVGQALSPPPPETVEVVAFSADVAGGATLGPGSLEIRRVPRAVVPSQAVSSIAEVSGRVLAVPRPRGAIVVASDVVSPALGKAAPGKALVPVRITDPDVIALLRVGDRVDVIAADETPRTLARAARVAAMPAPSSSGGGLAAPADQRGSLLVLEVDATDGPALVTAASGGRLSVLLA